MEIIDNRALKICVRDPDRITSFIPRSKYLGARQDGLHEVLVHWGMDETQVLRNLKIKNVPGTIIKEYNWPGIYRPFDHQRKTASFLSMHKRAYCLSQMGCGKTASAIWAADYLMEKGIINRVLIVCPLSIMDAAWRNDIFRVAMHRTVSVAHGSREKRKSVLAAGTEFVIINYDGVEVVEREIANGGFNLIIIDECFPAGTKVSTPIGYKNIEELSEGDIIDSSWGPRPVTKVFKKQTNSLVEVSFDDGRKIRCTPDHPFATDSGWVAAKNLKGKRCLSSGEVSLLRERILSGDIPSEESSLVLFKSLLEDGTIDSLYDDKLPSVRNAFYKETQREKHTLQRRVRVPFEKNRALFRGEGLSSVRNPIPNADILKKPSPGGSLFKIMRDEVEMGKQTQLDDGRGRKGGGFGQRQTQRKTGPCLRGNSTKNKSIPHKRGTYESARWERNRTITSRIFASDCPIPSVHLQFRNPYKNAARFGIPNMLQTRLRMPCANDRGGSRRVEPQYIGETAARPEKRIFFDRPRVDSVTYIEQNSFCDVWNLEVEGPNDYVVDGILVHNCNHYKNSTSARWKVMNRLITADTWVWAMTGSPASQSPTDAYGLAKLISPQTVPRFYGAFRDMVMTKVSNFRYIPKPDAQDTVYKVLQPAVRYTKEQCLDLPEMTYSTREVPLTAQQKKYYNELKKDMMIRAAGEDISSANAAVNIQKLFQVACGSCYSDTKEVIEFDVSNRLSELGEILEEASHKVLIFASFRHSIHLLQDKLSENYTVDVIHGGVSAGKRSELIHKFQTEPDPRILVIQPQAAAHGVTLTAANTIVWWGLTTSYETYVQANARVHRPGQVNPCTVIHLIGSPVEKHFLENLHQKNSAQVSLMELYNKEIHTS